MPEDNILCPIDPKQSTNDSYVTMLSWLMLSFCDLIFNMLSHEAIYFLFIVDLIQFTTSSRSEGTLMTRT